MRPAIPAHATHVGARRCVICIIEPAVNVRPLDRTAPLRGLPRQWSLCNVHPVVLRFLAEPPDSADGGQWRGRRVFVVKTVRGALVAIAVSIIAVLQGRVRIPALEYFDYRATHLPLLGLLLGLGFVVGELPNSFIKRQRGVAAGVHGGPWHAVGDHLDSVIGALLLLSLIWVPPLRVWLIALVLGGGIHIAVNGLFVLLGVKRRAL